MIRSGGCSLASFSAWSPLAAISTMVSPLRSSVCLTSPAMSFSSSTTSTRIFSAPRAVVVSVHVTSNPVPSRPAQGCFACNP